MLINSKKARVDKFRLLELNGGISADEEKVTTYLAEQSGDKNTTKIHKQKHNKNTQAERSEGTIVARNVKTKRDEDEDQNKKIKKAGRANPRRANFDTVKYARREKAMDVSGIFKRTPYQPHTHPRLP